jgi:6-phosphogluconolactonase
LTPPAINSANHVFFLVTGRGKAEALANVLEGEYRPEQWPAQRIQPEHGTLIWFIDEDAASELARR